MKLVGVRKFRNFTVTSVFQHLYVSLSEVQIKREDEIAKNPLSKVGNTLKSQSHIHGFGPGRATVHPDLSNRGASA